MTNDTFEVYVGEELVGHLTVGFNVRPSVTFHYASTWLARPGTFAIDPELPLSRAPFARAGTLFGAFRDSAPDQWGRGLLARSTPDRFLTESDYLLGVSDHTRQGALRYRDDNGTWLSDASPVPVLMDLPHLQRAAREAERGTQPPLRELAAAGAGTGGARPKVVVSDGTYLWIAKFSQRDDEIATEPAEYVVSRLAQRAGITMSTYRLLPTPSEPILLTKRFDRNGAERLSYLSALSLLEHAVGPERGGLYDYLEMADVLPEWSERPTEDLEQLWRRIAFGAVVRNTDDHLRNHAFLRTAGTWRLSPAYDINTDVRPWTPFVTSIDGETGEGRLEALIRNADYFRLTQARARAILAEIVAATTSLDGLDGLDGDQIPAETWSRVTTIVAAGTATAQALLG